MGLGGKQSEVDLCVTHFQRFYEFGENEEAIESRQQSQATTESPTSQFSPSEASSRQTITPSSQTSHLDLETHDSTPLRWRNLSEVYERNLYFVEPENHNDASLDES